MVAPSFEPRLGEELAREEIRHYSRHLIIPEIGTEGQRRLKGARVLMIGAGGLGSPAGMYLAAAGVGTIGLVEFDTVDTSNLQRQVLYSYEDIGKPKLAAATARLRGLNPHIDVVSHECRLDSSNALQLIQQYDLVVDGTDNFATRYLVNDACVLAGRPNVYASIFRFEGLLSVFNFRGGPCYRCLYPSPPPPGFAPSCAEGGVFGVLPGILGALQATEAIKLITGVGRPMGGRLLQFDALELAFREFRVDRDPSCCICSDSPTQTGLIDYVTFCGDTQHDIDLDAASTPGAIEPLALAARLDAGELLQLVDVRSLNEHQIVHINGSILAPLDELDEHLHVFDPDVPVVCYCKTGVRSLSAARFLLQKGFGDVVSLQGGIQAWARDVDHAAAVY